MSLTPRALKLLIQNYLILRVQPNEVSPFSIMLTPHRPHVTSSSPSDLIPRFFTASTIYPSISRCCWSACYRRPVLRLHFHHASGSLLLRLLCLITTLLEFTQEPGTISKRPRGAGGNLTSNFNSTTSSAGTGSDALGIEKISSELLHYIYHPQFFQR